jgi:methyltransferase family protein
MTAGYVRVSSSWLALREPADAAARAGELAEHVPATDRWVIHDLACGTGSMGRWLAPLLRGPQHWVLHDRDPDLLEVAAADPPAGATVEIRQSDITRLCSDDLAGATLITSSALLDLMTADELAGLVSLCAGRPTLLTLSVTGSVEPSPADPLDGRVAAAFNDHQRRGGLLGPDAVEAAADEFCRLGAEVLISPSPWRLGAPDADLAAEWFRGWVEAGCEQEPELADEIGAYSDRRLAGPLAVTVGHADLLALPR